LSNSDRSRPADTSAHLGKTEDIPAALRNEDPDRDRSNFTSSSATAPRLPFGLIGLGLGILVAGGALFSVLSSAKAPSDNFATPTVAASDPQNPDPAASNNSQPADVDNLLNHLSYDQAPDSDLASIGGNYRLRKAAASKFQSMVSAARSSGVNITTISAFRSIEDQKKLFFGVGAQRGQQPTKRAEVSAPPKYSEHHTGYAIDIGDSSVPATNLNQNFDTTPAYKWLKANAATYSFELSFPKDNIQKVSYEPWHWRFVGDINSLETFYKAHNLKGK
jgi:zinc D-Ala-D-Ala carboxypeptidase